MSLCRWGAAAGCWRERGHAVCTAGACAGSWWAGLGAGQGQPLLRQPPLLQRFRESGEAAPGGCLGEETPVSKVTFQFLL